MDMYAFALALGAAGLAVMTLLGLHHGQGTGPHGHSHSHDMNHGGSGHHPASPPGHAHHHGDPGHHSGLSPHWPLFLSPRIWFSLLVGFGATGLLIQERLAGLFQLGLALLGALAFEALLFRPVWSLVARFASEPALTLESGIMDDAEAVTGFNRQGEGLVRLDLDGQVVQLLGVLTADERAAGVRVTAGDRLMVEEVDAARQRCTVSRRSTADPLPNSPSR